MFNPFNVLPCFQPLGKSGSIGVSFPLTRVSHADAPDSINLYYSNYHSNVYIPINPWKVDISVGARYGNTQGKGMEDWFWNHSLDYPPGCCARSGYQSGQRGPLANCESGTEKEKIKEMIS